MQSSRRCGHKKWHRVEAGFLHQLGQFLIYPETTANFYFILSL